MRDAQSAENRVVRVPLPDQATLDRNRANARRLLRSGKQPPVFVVVMDDCGCVVAANWQSVTDRVASMVAGTTSRAAVGREAAADRRPCRCYARQSEIRAAAGVAVDEWTRAQTWYGQTVTA